MSQNIIPFSASCDLRRLIREAIKRMPSCVLTPRTLALWVDALYLIIPSALVRKLVGVVKYWRGVEKILAQRLIECGEFGLIYSSALER
jgi:hypothetical protein